jgi:hypothetical protein
MGGAMNLIIEINLVIKNLYNHGRVMTYPQTIPLVSFSGK